MKRDDEAYLWARWLAPVYSVTVANVKGALRLQASCRAASRLCFLQLWRQLLAAALAAFDALAVSHPP